LQELPPAQVGVANRYRWNAEPFADPADRRGADALTDFEQFALNALIAPARIVAGYPLDQVRQGNVDRRLALPGG
jgi:hypothetical protein